MASELWTHQFCLACDKQVHVDGAAYCSESCRLADQETTSTPTSRASSPGFPPSGWAAPTWTAPSKPRFYLSPAYDFSNAQPYGTAPLRNHSLSSYAASRPDGLRPMPGRSLNLSPSSSHSSLCSMQSTTTTSDSNNLSESARQELKAYAISFENVRLQRRRSY